jgi:hypothetical protein
MRYSRVSLGEKLDFFRNYYAPAWSIIYWLIHSGTTNKGLENRDIDNAVTAHSMAMSLHSLDDHLNDGEMPTTHLALLLRSQLWMIMNRALSILAGGVKGGKKIVQGFIDDYYSGIRCSENAKSLDSYCDLFSKQMATGFIVPVLVTKKMTLDDRFAACIQGAFGSFGIAWRLLDDIKDIKADMIKGDHSAVYVCLPEDSKKLWDETRGEKTQRNMRKCKAILNSVLENSIIERIINRIRVELGSAESMADDCDMIGLADEFRCLLRPLENGGAFHEREW